VQGQILQDLVAAELLFDAFDADRRHRFPLLRTEKATV
jgi:hypothetical protein